METLFSDLVASVLYCSMYHCTSFDKNEFKILGVQIFVVLPS